MGLGLAHWGAKGKRPAVEMLWGFRARNSLSRKNRIKCHNLPCDLSYSDKMALITLEIPKDMRRSEAVRLCILLGLTVLLFLKLGVFV